MDKVLIINKPLGITSMDVIRKLRKKLNIRKIGHAGTLDPLATGVLIVCTGKETKQINQFMDQEKEYEALVDLSAFSETDDAEGMLTKINIENIPNLGKVKEALKSFIGQIEQIPPKYSAIKINGQAAYKIARSGKNLEMKPRQVQIDCIEVLEYSWPILKIKVICQKGTYIRSLARDIGTALNAGGYLTGLIRTRIGEFKLEDSIELD